MEPEGYVDSKHPEYVCQLQRTMYGLKQGPVQFNKKISGTLENIGLIPIYSDRCVLTGRVGGDIVYTAFYVDDAIVASPSKRAIESVTAELSKTYELKVGEGTTFGGIEIYREKGTGAIKSSQANYVRKLLETFDMSNAKPVSTTMAVCVQLPKLDVPEVKFPYREAVGSLLFTAMVTRPDITNAVSQLNQHLPTRARSEKSTSRRLSELCVTFRGTINLALEYGADGGVDMIGYVDAYHAGNHATRRSMTGYIFALNEMAITWASQRQSVVALSTYWRSRIYRDG